mgnify:CR=1 FL=1
MKIYGILLCAALLASGSLFVPHVSAGELSAQERAVTLEGGIQGIVLEPEADSPLPVVLMLHGFGSQKDEVGDMYKRLAAALGEQGIALLVVSFRGWAQSAGM